MLYINLFTITAQHAEVRHLLRQTTIIKTVERSVVRDTMIEGGTDMRV